MSKHLFSQACLLLLLLNPGSSVLVQNPAQPSVADLLSPNEALELVRLLNTAQAESRLTSSSYLSLASLLKHRLVSRQSIPVVVQDDTLGELRGTSCRSWFPATANGIIWLWFPFPDAVWHSSAMSPV